MQVCLIGLPQLPPRFKGAPNFKSLSCLDHVSNLTPFTLPPVLSHSFVVVGDRKGGADQGKGVS